MITNTNKEINQDNPEKAGLHPEHVRNWIHVLGNEIGWQQACKEPWNRDFIKLAQTVAEDKTFQAIDLLYGIDLATDPTAVGHRGLEKAFDRRYAEIADKIYAAHDWVQALKEFRIK